MKALIINASPRANGQISQMLSLVADELTARGAEVTTIRSNDLNVRPCVACMRCRTERRCPLPTDDAHRMADLIGASDILVLGAPCYWGNMPGTLKVLLDRMVYALLGERPNGIPMGLHKGKRCALLSTSTTPWPFNILLRQSAGTIRAMKDVCRFSGFSIVGTLQKGNTRKSQTLTRSEQERCRKLARRLIKH